jgi:nicotinamidase-related amidase
MILLDHQTGIMQTVQDIDPLTLRSNVVALAKTAEVFGLPTVLSASAPEGPNGPLLPELRELHPEAPYVARPGQINAWDNRDFREAVEATGRGTLIMAGTVSSVCLAYPAIDAVANGYRVYGVIDASGTWSRLAEEATIARLTQAGVIVTDTLSMMAELQRDWRNPTAEQFAGLYHDHLPAYGGLMESFAAATAPGGIAARS